MLSPNAITAVTSSVKPAALGAAAFAGIAAAFGPSTYPLIPAVLGYEVAQHADRRAAIGRALLIVAGMVVFDAILGAAAAAAGLAVAKWLAANLAISYAITAVVMIVLGLRFLGVLKFGMPAPALSASPKETRWYESFLLGCLFGVAACPACTPLLLAVLLGAIAAKSIVFGALLLAIFAIGRGIPLIAVAVSANAFRRLRVALRFQRWVDLTGGWLLIASAVYFGYQAWWVWSISTTNGPSPGMPGM